MESSLYPLKFMPLFKNKLWGGNKIKQLGFDYDPLPNCGELWALSAVEGNESIITNGFLSENTLPEALEIYMGELIGEQNYKHFGNNFPLLIKLINSADKLSIQVHPDNETARNQGFENGKTEMWYILEAENGADIVDGFSRNITSDECRNLIEAGKIEDALHYETPQKGDVFFIPAGRIHGLGKGLLLAEIQQTSDTTYRVYDYNRREADGNLRDLHIEQALESLYFEAISDGKTHYSYAENNTVPLVQCPYFTTNLIALTKPLRKDFSQLDSFVVYMCVEGISAIKAMDTICPIHAGECVLVPAVAEKVELFCDQAAKLLEVYVDPTQWNEPEVDHYHDFDWLAQFLGDNGEEPIDCDCDDDEGCHHHNCHHHHESF